MDAQETTQIECVFEEWKTNLRLRDLEVLKKIEQKLDMMFIADGQLLIEYHLLYCQQRILEFNYHEVKKHLEEVSHYQNDMSDSQQFYFYFCGGRNFYFEKNFDRALEDYKQAQKKLSFVSDDLDKAEFHYKVGQLYYNLDFLFDAHGNAEAALIAFNDAELQNREADCHNLIGLIDVDLKQYADAESHFHFALDFAKKHDIPSLRIEAAHNVGLLYAEQNLSSTAITWLNHSLEAQSKPSYKTIYYLCRESFKLSDYKSAEKFLMEGIRLCKGECNNTYLMKFQMLNALYLEKEVFEGVYEKGITFFSDQEDWDLTRDYSRQMADCLYVENQYDKAADYYRLVLEASDKIMDRGALH